MRKRKCFVGFALALVAIFGLGSAAFAADGTITPTSPFSNPTQAVTIDYSGLTPNQPYIFAQCNNDQGAAFDPNADCSPFHTLFVNGNATGSGQVQLTLKEIPDDADDNGWTCDRTGAADGTVNDSFGRRKYSQCQLRINDNTLSSTANVKFIPIAWTGGPDPVVPEAPFSVLLPLGGIAVIGAAYFVLRSRKPAMSL